MEKCTEGLHESSKLNYLSLTWMSTSIARLASWLMGTTCCLAIKKLVNALFLLDSKLYGTKHVVLQFLEWYRAVDNVVFF